MKQLIFALIDALGLNAWLRHRHRGQIKVLLYHNVTPGAAHFDNALTPEEFDAQLAYLKRHYNPVSLGQDGEWIGVRRDRVNVLVSFDDGFRNNLTHVLPVLQKHGIRATFFLIADCVPEGAPPTFLVERIEDEADAEQYRTLDIADARAMQAAGMTIGSHSRGHRDFSSLDDDAMHADARSARDMLEVALGTEIANFAFPWGKHRAGQEIALLGAYRRVFLTRHGFAWPEDRVVPRNEVSTLAHLKAAASGALDALRPGAKAH